jgi:hypothetical protein
VENIVVATRPCSPQVTFVEQLVRFCAVRFGGIENGGNRRMENEKGERSSWIFVIKMGAVYL